MMEKIYASGEPVGILAWHPDRLARNSVDGGWSCCTASAGVILA
jgi:hypothetical protein